MEDAAEYKKISEVRISKLYANIIGGIIAVLLIFLFLGLINILPHRVSTGKLSGYEILIFYILIIPSICIHELLHAYAAVKYGGLNFKKDITFGFNWKGLMPYCHLKKPIEVKYYRIVGIMPLYIMGTISLSLIFIYPSLLFAAICTINIAACIGDIMMFLELRKFDEELLVYDHPTEPGFDVYKSI